MKENQAISSLLKRLWPHVSPRRRAQFALLLMLMLLASFAEILSIGAVLPFLGVLASPEQFFYLPATQSVIDIFGITEPKQLLLPLTIIFVLSAFIAGVMRFLLLWATTRLSFATGTDLSIAIYSRTLYQPYIVHCARNSSEVINSISTKTSEAIAIVINILNLISSSFILTAITSVLLAVNPTIALIAFSGFSIIYMLITFLVRRTLQTNSQITAHESTQVIKSLQEGLGGVRDVLIDGSQDYYCQTYKNANVPYRRAQASNYFIVSAPRYAMEVLGIVLIALLAFTQTQQDGSVNQSIAVIGTLAMSAQRLLPILQQIYSSWSGIIGGQASLQDVLKLLEQPIPLIESKQGKEVFKDKISLNHLSFRYSPQTPFVLNNINLSIAKGSRIGFIGETGSGKSTLLDIIMGLLKPTNGELLIDGQAINEINPRAWQANIAHVPQSIFLIDGSIEENIAFGVPRDKIDIERVHHAAKLAQISDTINSWPEHYKTLVGERGVRLSGGQRQRIGIARALYKQADVIIFDEATSALDNQTETAVMQAIESLERNVTLLIIAHRLSTLKNCTQIVELLNGCIKSVGSYNDVVKV